MRSLHRRDLLKAGLGGLTGSAFLGSSLELVPAAVAQALSVEGRFLLEPGLTTRLTSGMAAPSPWAIPERFEQFVDELLAPMQTNSLELEAWAVASGDCCSVGFGSRNPQLNALMQTTLAGSPDVADISAHMVQAVADSQRVDLTLDFLHGSQYLTASSFDVSRRRALPVLVPTDDRLVRSAAETFGPSAVPPHVEMFGWRLQIRGPEVASYLGRCVQRPVKHFNIDVFRQTTPGRYAYVVNYHLGTYRDVRNRRCFVLYDSEHPSVCLKYCNPSRDDLMRMIKYALTAAAIVAGVVIAGWIILAIAEAAALALLPALLLL